MKVGTPLAFAVRVFALCFLPLLSAHPLFAGENAAPAPNIEANRNQTPGGTLKNGVLELRLELREGSWHPYADDGPSLTIAAFGEEGKAPQIPGPLIRVPQGTVIHATVRNLLAVNATVFGLFERPGDWGKGLEIPVGEVREVRFPAGAPGTYFYWAETVGKAFDDRVKEDTQLTGAFVVDAPEASSNDRISVIGLWPGNAGEVLAVNGKSFPFDEPFTFTVGEEVRWRVINASVSAHAMHLHGFFYRVDSTGNGARDDIYPAAGRRAVVTERMEPGGTMLINWTPHTPGNWLFHCHMVAHMSAQTRLSLPGKKSQEMPLPEHDPGAGMAGLVIGIHVRAKEGESVAEDKPVRHVRMLLRERPGAWPAPPGVGVQIQEDGQEPQPKEMGFPGPPLLLTRGEPVEITVVNQLEQPATVHWHGMELASGYDGVPSWSGDAPAQTVPAIPAGGSFTVRMTPRYAGTYIYHTHWHDQMQLRGGLYGALLVLEPGQKYDPEKDRIFLIGLAGMPGKGRLVVNGQMEPIPVTLTAGTKYRLRLINISTNEVDTTVTLRDGEKIVSWRAAGKDGQELPPAQATVREARQHVTVGETYDFEIQPEKPGLLLLETAETPGAFVTTPLIVEAPPAAKDANAPQ